MTEEALALLRQQRHSFLNHLQVISGWLQLGREDRASHYLATVADRLTTESQATRHLPPALGLVAVALSLEAETYGVRIDWRVSNIANLAALVAPADLQARVSSALQGAASLAESERQVKVGLGPEGLVIHTPSARGEG